MPGRWVGPPLEKWLNTLSQIGLITPKQVLLDEIARLQHLITSLPSHLLYRRRADELNLVIDQTRRDPR